MSGWSGGQGRCCDTLRERGSRVAIVPDVVPPATIRPAVSSASFVLNLRRSDLRIKKTGVNPYTLLSDE